MSSPSDESRGVITLAADIYPETIDAGAEIFLEAFAVADPPCDFEGHVLTIKDEDGGELGVAVLTEFDGQTNYAGHSFTAPQEPGEYHWTLVCPAHSETDISYDEVALPITILVKAHATQIAVWDVPTAITAGETFKMKIGIKCSSDCDFSHREFAILDDAGTEIARAALPREIWPGTAGLYFAEIELQAPSEEGLYDWNVHVANSDAPPPHDAGQVNFGVRVVRAPECTVTVEARNEVGAPLAGAQVTMRPYKAKTDAEGIAQLRVAKGSYRLFVAKGGYLNFALPVGLTGDLTVKADLEIEPIEERN